MATAAAHQDPTRRGAGGRVLGYLGLLVTVLMILVPIVFIVITSLKHRNEIYTQPVTWIPHPFTAQNYHSVLTEVPFLHYLANSVLITAVLMLSVPAIIWATAAVNATTRWPAKGRTGVLVALGAAVLAGGGPLA